MTEPHQPTLFTPSILANGGQLDLLRGAIIPFDKPLGWSSFAVVNYFRTRVKYILGLRKIKVGHAGTLDPKATGLLVLCTGGATKHIETLMSGTKEYLAEVKLGATTPSYDTEQEEDACYPWEHITEGDVAGVLEDFLGEQMQVPPLFSATSIGGKRAYKFARKGCEVELPPKRIVIEAIELLSFRPPYVEIRVCCSRGTYIRSLARDIGTRLHSGAYLTSLRRTRSGSISLEESFSVEEVEMLLTHLSPIDQSLLEERLKQS